MELDHYLVEVVAVLLRRRWQRAGALDGAYDRQIVGLVARAALQAHIADLTLGRELGAHQGDELRLAIGLHPVVLDDAEDALAVGQELGPDDGPSAPRPPRRLPPACGPVPGSAPPAPPPPPPPPPPPVRGGGGDLLVALPPRGPACPRSFRARGGCGRRRRLRLAWLHGRRLGLVRFQ